MSKEDQNINTVLELLDDEKQGRVESALSKLHPDYSMTWVYKTRSGNFFPKHEGIDPADFEDVYRIIGRDYDVKNISATGQIVFVELVESYPDPKDKTTEFRTPEVIVLEFQGGKVIKGRHYCDPAVSHAKLSKEKISKLYH